MIRTALYLSSLEQAVSVPRRRDTDGCWRPSISSFNAVSRTVMVKRFNNPTGPVSVSRRVRLARLATAAILLASAAGCDDAAKPVSGQVGVTIDASGDFGFVVVWCAAPPDGLTVYHEDQSNTVDPNPVDTDHHVAELPQVSSSTFNAVRPQAPWSLAKGSVQLTDNVTYSALAGVAKQRSEMIHVIFRTTDVEKRLRPGQVLFQPQGDLKDMISSTADFVRQVQADC
jgi:hypothetical protein